MVQYYKKLSKLCAATGEEIRTDPRAAKEIKKSFTCQYRNTVTLQRPDELVKALAATKATFTQ